MPRIPEGQKEYKEPMGPFERVDVKLAQESQAQALPQQQAQESQAQESQALSLDEMFFDENRWDDREIPSLGLGVLFSHSSRIRCFLDMLYPDISPEKSIFQLMKDYENTYNGEQDIKFKFYNCVVFVLIKRRDDFFLCMKNEGTKIQGEKPRIGLSNFRDLLGFKGYSFDTNTYIKLEIKEPVITRSRTYTKEKLPSQGLKDLLDQKDFCIIRHGQSTHNESSRGLSAHLYTDSSLTSSGIQDAFIVATDIASFFKRYANATHRPSFYVSELFRTQQTAMIFVNIINYELVRMGGPAAYIFNSTATNPIILMKISCNHEFSESNLDRGACYINQSERANRFQKWSWKKENVPEHRTHFTTKREYVSYQHVRVTGRLSAATRRHTEWKSFFHVDDTNSHYNASADCSLGVFGSFGMFSPEPRRQRYQALSVSDYTDMIVAAGYDFPTDKYVTGRKDYLGLRDWWARRSWKSSGGSLKKNKKKKRRTIRRNSKRFTKKRNSRRTNKKRLTNKRRTNKKRFTKRR